MEINPMRIARFVGLSVVFATAGCGGVKPAPPGAAATSAPQVALAPTPPPPALPAPAPPGSPPSASAAPSAPAAAAAAAPVEPSAASQPAPSAAQNAAKAAPPAAKSPAKATPPPAAPAPPAPPPKKEAAPPETAKTPAPPPLDMKSLETRLKDTKAIGVMTKIALKNQVDDLLNQFRAYYQGKVKTTLAELRRPFDLLVLKVLSLLQDSDPTLASAIAASREAIWSILSDPVKFAAI